MVGVNRPSLTYPRTVLALCVLAYFGSRVGQIAISPLIPEITTTFEVSKASIGTALTGMWIAYALVQFPAGVFGDRFGERPVVLVSLAIGVVGSVVLALSPSYQVFVIMVVVLGAGVGLYYNVGTILLARQTKNVGQVIGIHRIGGQAAGFLAPIAVAAVSVRYGWRTGLLVGAVAAFPALLLFWWGVRPTPPTMPDTRVRDRFDWKSTVNMFARTGFVSTTMIATLAEFVGVAARSFIPTFLIEAHGLSLAMASFLFSVYFVVIGIAQPMTGWVSDRSSRGLATALTLIIGMIGYVMLVLGSSIGIITTGIIFAAYAMSWSAPVQAKIIDILSEDEQGTGFGIVRTLYILLGAFGSAVIGTIADGFDWTTAFGVLAVILFMAVLILGVQSQLAEKPVVKSSL